MQYNLWNLLLSFSVNLGIEDFLRSFEQNSTSAQKVEYYESIRSLEKNNLIGEYYPKLNFTGQISYQSETIKIPISSPLFSIPEISKDQYYTAIELDQLLFDGFAIANSRKVSDSKFIVNESNTKLESYKIKENIVQIYFGILILQRQKEINQNITADLLSRKKQFESMLANGVILKSALNQVDIELIKRKRTWQNLKTTLVLYKTTLASLSQIKEERFLILLHQKKYLWLMQILLNDRSIFYYLQNQKLLETHEIAD